MCVCRDGGGGVEQEHSISAHILATCFFLMAAVYSIVWLNHNVSHLSSTEGGDCQYFAITHSTTMYIFVHLFLYETYL